MNLLHLSKLKAVAVVLALGSVTGCYSFKAARKDIGDKETELQRLQNDINQESQRRKTLESDSRAK